jgi:hypothetical protein
MPQATTLEDSIRAVIAAALRKERDRVVTAAAQTRSYSDAVVLRHATQLYPDVTRDEWYARQQGRPWPPGDQQQAAPVEAPPMPRPYDDGDEEERTCECDNCTDETCQGDCDPCQDHLCRQCYDPDDGHYASDCCGYCDECDTHWQDASPLDDTCDRGHCHTCDHRCENY